MQQHGDHIHSVGLESWAIPEEMDQRDLELKVELEPAVADIAVAGAADTGVVDIELEGFGYCLGLRVDLEGGCSPGLGCTPYSCSRSHCCTAMSGGMAAD